MPPGILNFAGRVSHNYWYLFGEAQRTELDALNRQLRQADQQLRQARDDAARARAGDGTSAHTTPVYVVREGLRFWKFDGLEELLAKREESLRQIEGLIAEAKRLNAEGRLETDRYRKQLASQGDALLERVGLARNIYAELRRTAEKERNIRERGKR